jgi:hypothetical protein
MVSTRRRGKAARDKILALARDGDLPTRVAAQKAYRLRLLQESRSDSDLDEEMTPEAEAGAMLDAEQADDMHRIRIYYEKVHEK